MENKKSKKVLKIILIIILFIILLLLIHTIRNFIIVSNLQQKASEYVDSTNYHIKSVANEQNGVTITINYYKKDSKQVMFIERNVNGEITKLSVYDNGERKDMFIDAPNSKTAELDINSNLASFQIYNHLRTDNILQTFIFSAIAQISKEDELYEIKNFATSNIIFGTEENVVYIDKDTGLTIKNNTNNIITEREYEFNNVDDSIFREPDISEYKLK